ncbi:alpha/beta hydrolase fold-domain-containing protein [Gongronella butleri]|nr:alpha/beta hydrolase fold-domain-containing protein [Gongronella butleri]
MTLVTPTEYPAHPVLLAAIMNTTGLSREEALKPHNVRQFLKEQAALFPVADAVREYRRIPFENRDVELVIVRPPNSEGKILPIILFFHGGGYFVGGIESHGILIHELARRTPAVVVHVEYSLSPEVKHPVAMEECYTALNWVNANAAAIGGDPEKLAVVGDSAGGNMVAAITALAKERGNKSINAQVLLYPMLGTDFHTSTYEEYQNDSYLPRNLMMYVWSLYLTEEAKNSRFAVPMLATVEQLEDLPPALLITAEKDVLRDDGETYIKRLRKAGVDTVALRYFNVRHGFFTEPEITETADAGIDQIVAFLMKKWGISPAKL